MADRHGDYSPVRLRVSEAELDRVFAGPAPMPYRKDIDGLGGVAVLMVVGFHAFPALAPSGFIGVDVFFVISGFLITGILLDQFDRGDFSLTAFYDRRIRRLFPALALVLVSTLVIGWFAMF